VAAGIIREEVIGRARLLLGDCRDILPSLERVDLVCTDPPYGIGEDGGKFRGRLGQKINVLPKKAWDAARPDAGVFDLLLRAGEHCIIWGGNYFADLLPPSKGWLYWRKLMGGDFADGELAWTSRDKALREFTYCPKGRGGEHPTQKPIPVMRWCLDFFPEAQSIVDPFLGSGTTGIVAVQRGLSFIGIERDPDYFEIACRRIRETNGDDAGPLFGEAA
jgi:site-specific DNA-methyltransferase (adenine-specific)/modification methylase